MLLSLLFLENWIGSFSRRKFFLLIIFSMYAGLISHWMEQELGRASESASTAEASSKALSLLTHMKGIFAGLLICLGACLAVGLVEALVGWKKRARVASSPAGLP